MTPPAGKEIEGQVGALADLPLADLKYKWREVYKTESPRRISRNVLVRAIAFRLQEKAFGGMKPVTRRQLAAIAEGRTRPGRASPGSIRIKPGTRLVQVVFRSCRVEQTLRSLHFASQSLRSKSVL